MPGRAWIALVVTGLATLGVAAVPLGRGTDGLHGAFASLGYVSLALKLGYLVNNAQEGIEALSVKVGMVLIVLGGMHFFNLFIFSRMRRRKSHHDNRPPIRPDTFTAVKQEA